MPTPTITNRAVSHLRLSVVLALGLSLAACGGGEEASAGDDTRAARAASSDGSGPGATASGPDACAALTAAEFAAILGAKPATVTSEPPPASLPPAISQCTYVVNHAGIETTVTYRRESARDAAAAALQRDRLSRALAEGEKIGTRTYGYEPTTLRGMDGALSEAKGGKYLWVRLALWVDDSSFNRMTVVTSLEEGDAAPVPSPELFEQLIGAAAG